MHTATVVMANTPSDLLVSQFANLLQHQSYAYARALLAQHLEFFCHQVDHIQAGHLLLLAFAFPGSTNADLLYIEGVLRLCTGDYAASVTALALARALYSETAAYRQVVQTTLALVQVALATHDLDAAYAHLEKSQPLLPAGLIDDCTIIGDFCLRMAQVLLARRRFAASHDYGQQALTAYTQAKVWSGRMEALLQLALLAVHWGNYEEAESRLRLVRQGLQRSPSLETQLLYVELHLCGHRRQLVQALHLGQRYRNLSDRMVDGKARLHACLLLGNLYRELEDFVTAARWYRETLQLVLAEERHPFQQQLDLEYTWLDIVEGRLLAARQRIYTYLGQVQLEPAMNFQTQLAIIHLLEGNLLTAERLLQESLVFYHRSGDRLACCALHTYLAYIALQQQHAQAILYHLEQILGWMSRQQIEGFPQWWHPGLLAAVCSQALAADLYSALSERILVNYLGNHGINALTHYLHTDDIETRRRAYRLLHIISGETANLLAHLPEGAGKAVLTTLLRDGRLRTESYPHLEQELMTANYRRLPNVTLLAVFGLYINGVSRAEIAEQLACSVENVRNYITQIYQHFGVTVAAFSTRRARWQRLVEIARTRGYVE